MSTPIEKVVNIFLAIVSQEGGGTSAKSQFVETSTFTTTVGGNIKLKVKLNPVSNQFPLICADTTLTTSRVDLHDVTISLAFPQVAEKTELAAAATGGPMTADTTVGTAASIQALEGQVQKLTLQNVTVGKDVQGVHRLKVQWQARYNLCVQDGRNREDKLSQLRLTAP